MNGYSIEFVSSSRKEFEKLPVNVHEKVIEALRLLSINPYSEFLKVKKLKDSGDLYRIRVRDYRVVYAARNQTLRVIVIKIGHRNEISKY